MSADLSDSIAAHASRADAVVGPDPWQTRGPQRWKAWTCPECEALFTARPIQPHHRPRTMIACDNPLLQIEVQRVA